MASSDPARVHSKNKESHRELSRSQNVDPSVELWNTAYDQLETDEATAEIATAYRETLAELLTKGELDMRRNATSPVGASTDTSVDNVAVQDAIRADKLGQLKDWERRSELLTRFVMDGQDKIKLTTASQRVGTIAEGILKAQPLVNIALQVPHAAPAALPWAGVLIGLQILANPANAKKSNLDGISYVCSRMEWYSALCRVLLDNMSVESQKKGGPSQSVQQQIEERVISLYKAILFYQMKSVCVYYKSRGLVFLQGLTNWNDWGGYLKAVTDAEQSLEKDSTQFREEQNKLALSALVECAQGHERELKDMHEDIHQALENQLTFHKSIHEDEKNRKYIEDLYVTNPKDEMTRIERKKGELLNEVFSWVLDTPQFVSLTSAKPEAVSPSPRLLWIKGQAGIEDNAYDRHHS